MMKRSIWLFTLGFLALFTIRCATNSATRPPGGISSPLPGKFLATRFPEVKLWTISGDLYKGKMTALEGDMITLSPFPYWNVERLKIGISDIEQIELIQKPQASGTGFAYGFGVGCTAIGLWGASVSEYNTNFRFYLAAAPLCGLVIGLIGGAIGVIGDLTTPGKFEFGRLPYDLKIDALARIMGLIPSSKY